MTPLHAMVRLPLLKLIPDILLGPLSGCCLWRLAVICLKGRRKGDEESGV